MKSAVAWAAGLVLAVSSLPAFADAGALETLRTECAAQLKPPPPACQCIVDKASQLNDSQQAFVAAAVTTRPRRQPCVGR